MGLIDRVQGLLDTVVELEPWTAQDAYNRSTYGAKRVVRARVQQGSHQGLNPNGQAIVAAYKIILGEPLAVDVRDRVTLPAAFGTRAVGGKQVETQPKIQSVQPVFYIGRHDHTVLLCG